MEGERCVREYLLAHPLVNRPITLLATGKAAAAMARGAATVLQRRLVEGLVITREGYAGAGLPDCLALREAGHPLPDARSLAAGEAAMALVGNLPDDHRLLVLTSGGSSALVEALPEGIGLDDLVRLNAWLVGSGLPIQAMNRIRQSVSRIKGGGLARQLRGQPVLNLLISDVPGDDPAVIGSGLFVPTPRGGPEIPVPDWVRELQQRAGPGMDASSGPRVEHRIIANNRLACEAAAIAARQAGLMATVHARPLEGEAEAMAHWLVEELDRLPPGIHVWGGESTVRLPPAPGRGGRNQHLALAAARRLAGREDLLLLAAATDGADGTSEDAGALVDGGTLRRGEEQGLDAADCLARADAGRFLEASGDLVHTGPTGTNVMDLVIARKAG